MGLVNAVVEPDDLLAHTYAYADAAGPLPCRAARWPPPSARCALDLHRGVGDAVDESGRRLAQMMTEPDFPRAWPP